LRRLGPTVETGLLVVDELGAVLRVRVREGDLADALEVSRRELSPQPDAVDVALRESGQLDPYQRRGAPERRSESDCEREHKREPKQTHRAQSPHRRGAP